MRAHVLVHVAERRVECRPVELASPGRGEVLMETRCSAISGGTEALIFSGAFPKGAALDVNIASLSGRFAYPFPYGYALVGDVTAAGAEAEHLVGKTVFAFHPHQDRAIVPAGACHPVPDGVAPEAALLLPQVETALNLVMDGAPLVGERVVVFGQGVVGLLTGRLLAEFPLSRLVAAEPLAGRRELAKSWGIAETIDPGDTARWNALLAGLGGADLVFELSGNMAALGLALETAGFDARVVIGSWYGAQPQPLALGDRFHRNRVRIVSSQVSTLSPVLSGRWNKQRRLDLAWRMVEKLAPQRLITQSFSLAECQRALETVCARADGTMQVIFRY